MQDVEYKNEEFLYIPVMKEKEKFVNKLFILLESIQNKSKQKINLGIITNKFKNLIPFQNPQHKYKVLPNYQRLSV